jgi:hypothetical protein
MQVSVGDQIRVTAGFREGKNVFKNNDIAQVREVKGDHISGVDPESREETLLFNPRQDTWNEHFDFDAGRFQLLGRTPTGRATIDQLRMNTSYQIEARKYWVEAGLYP